MSVCRSQMVMIADFSRCSEICEGHLAVTAGRSPWSIVRLMRRAWAAVGRGRLVEQTWYTADDDVQQLDRTAVRYGARRRLNQSAETSKQSIVGMRSTTRVDRPEQGGEGIVELGQLENLWIVMRV